MGTLVAQMASGSSHCAPSQPSCTTSAPGSAEMTTPDAFAACAALHACAHMHAHAREVREAPETCTHACQFLDATGMRAC
jgi:hypothetical protein